MYYYRFNIYSDFKLILILFAATIVWAFAMATVNPESSQGTI